MSNCRPRTTDVEQFFATCPRGLEAVLGDELTARGAQDVRPVDGGTGFRGPYALCYRVNLESRIASRVLWRIGYCRYRDENDIYAAARKLKWTQWFSSNETIRVETAAIKSPLQSLDFVTLRVKDAVCDVLREAEGKRPDVDTRTPDVRIHLFLTADEAVFYLDTSGDPLFKRGWRSVTGEAPLRENLAAGILRLAGWTPDQALLDPMCGSGTFLIEAALMALNRAPGINRRFGFERLRNFDAKAWEVERKQAVGKENKLIKSIAYGYDRSGDAIAQARQNVAALGLEKYIELKQCSFEDSRPPTPTGVLITNPPYGVRLEELDTLADWYPKLGDILKQRYSGWTAYILTADLRIAKLMRLKPSRRTPLFNGALECRLFKYELVAGSMRKSKSDASA